MADRIVVMNHGDIEQIGTPLEIYRRPASPFVADFVGSMNFLQGKVLGEGRVRLGPTELACATDGFAAGDEVGVCVRPEDVMVRNVTASTANRVGVTVGTLDFLGAFCRATLQPDGDIAPFVADFSINLMRDLAVAEGQRLEVALPADRLRLFHKT